MKKLFFLFLVISTLVSSFSAMADTIIKHNGEKIDCQVQKIEKGYITFSNKGEQATNIIGKYAVEKIVYDSGKEDAISPKYTVKNKYDASLVVLTENEKEVAGLKEVKTIPQSANSNFKGLTSLNKKTILKIQREAAKINAFIVLLSKQDGNNLSSDKMGICYTY